MPSPAVGGGKGFLGFLNSYSLQYPYSTALARFTSISPPGPSDSSGGPGNRSGIRTGSPLGIGWNIIKRKGSLSSAADDGNGMGVSGETGVESLSRRNRSWTRASYPLSTLIIVALIAFLMGSLLRSLISPADFIYVMPSLDGQEEVSSGWREIKRLVEVKYLVGGWDFQIAVVRRP